MRVVLVAEQLRRGVPGGIGTYVRGLAQGLRALGADGPEVALWASRPRRREHDPVGLLGPVVTSRLPGPVLLWAWDSGLGGFGGRADVVHASSLAVPPRRRAPVTAMVHDLAWRRVPDAFPARGRRWHEAALGRALARASVLLTPSSATADDLVGAGADAGRVEVVEEGADHLPPPDQAAAEACLRRAGVAGRYLLTVSTLEPRKNLARLAAAYQEARPRLPEPWPLVVVGPPGWGEQGPAPGEGVVLVGPVEGATLAALYAGARAVVYVPLVEGFGLPAVEAMAAGVPVVASPMPSTGGAALEVDPLDTGAIAAALVRAATDEGTRSALVDAGTRRAGALTWKATARRHHEIWAAVDG
ncbi:MAG TPA: glycosyltransferase family 1 protein [Acidimicrobiales bacterium]|nr:glycosyltransferase family 1 protein [Acidimicrobiales bacterium]